MAVTTRFPTTNAAYSGAGLTNPNNAHADDNTNATAAPGKNVVLGTRYGTFGFDGVVPSGATISQVRILYGYFVSTASSIATARTLARISAVDQATHDDTAEPLAETQIAVDITADRAWTRADLLDGTFEAVLEARQGNSSTAVTFNFDYIKVEVTYDSAVNLVIQNSTHAHSVENLVLVVALRTGLNNYLHPRCGDGMGVYTR